MFDNLSERLERSFKILKGEGKITEINVAETLKMYVVLYWMPTLTIKWQKLYRYSKGESSWTECADSGKAESVDGEDCSR